MYCLCTYLKSNNSFLLSSVKVICYCFICLIKNVMLRVTYQYLVHTLYSNLFFNLLLPCDTSQQVKDIYIFVTFPTVSFYIFMQTKNYLILFLYYTAKIQNKHHQNYFNINLYNTMQLNKVCYIILYTIYFTMNHKIYYS